MLVTLSKNEIDNAILDYLRAKGLQNPGLNVELSRTNNPPGYTATVSLVEEEVPYDDVSVADTVKDTTALPGLGIAEDFVEPEKTNDNVDDVAGPVFEG